MIRKSNDETIARSAPVATLSQLEVPDRAYWISKPRILEWLLRNRVVLLVCAHVLLFSLAYWLAFGLRFDFLIPADMYQRFWTSLPVLLFVKLVVFYSLGSFHGWWRYVTFADFTSLLRATLLSLAMIVVVDHFLLPFQIPRVVIVMDAVAAALLLALARSSWRLAREGIWPGVKVSPDTVPALIYSNSHETIVLAHQINSLSGLPYRIVGIVCDEEHKVGSNRAGMPIVATTEYVGRAARKFRAQEVLVVAGALSGNRLRGLRDHCESVGVQVKVIPPALSSLQGNGKIPIRDIEIKDLLQREPVELDAANISDQLCDQVILVTGAGGSIGSEICRQLLKFHPKELVLLDHRENSVFLIQNELEHLTDGTLLHPCVGDILDESRMRAIFTQFHPQYVYHAAAHKHVGLMEVNVGEAVKNNVFGTKNVADLADEFHVAKFVLISTDKAVNPTSVMGASKQVAERYIHAIAQESESAFVVVRFGNVLGSNGSVVPLFKEQIERGGPITITDSRMTRFFMTIPEAAQLVLQAGAMGKGGEIFVLEMGDQYPILGLAEDMVRLAGLPKDSIEIKVVGARPGEKLYEELYFDEEQMLETSHPKIHAAYHRSYSVSNVLEDIHLLASLLHAPDDVIRTELKRIIPEYQYTPQPAEQAH